MAKRDNFYKERPSDKVWWNSKPNGLGAFEFSFDKETIFTLFRDYPEKLTKKQKAIFDKENPFWADFFSDETEDDDGK